jgi:hypothetical protein
MPVSQTKKWNKLKLFKFSIILICMLLLLSEGLVRVYFYVKFKGLHTSVYTQGSPLQMEDAALVYKNRPYYVDYEKKYQYNEDGMKSAVGNFKMPVKHQDDLWVLLLGGSAMEGMGSNKSDKWFDITNVSDHPYEETIAAYLQKKLASNFPKRHVKVFNAAASGYTIEQSIARYKLLSQQYDFDWVISMDGVNEPVLVEGNEPAFYFSKKYFSEFPFKEYPLKYIIPVTQHSALFLILKQELYSFRLGGRVIGNKKRDFPERKFWIQQPAKPVLFDTADSRVKNAVNRFLRSIYDFDTFLQKKQKKHLLLIQPFLPFRDSLVFTPEERALYNYFKSHSNNPYQNQFMKSVYDSINNRSPLTMNIQNMTAVNTWKDWVLVDYCHFTQMANKKIADRLADYIIQGGSIIIFKN